LAVGDLAFQRKCFDRMESLINKQGKTVILVSHNIRQVARMCGRSLLFNKGQITQDGTSEEVCTTFYEENNQAILSRSKSNKKNTFDNGIAELLTIETILEDGQKTERINAGDKLLIKIVLRIHKEMIKPEIVVGTHTTDFVYLTAASTDTNKKIDRLSPGTHQIIFSHESFPLKAGSYGVRMVIFDQNRNSIFNEDNLLFFSVNVSQSESREPPLRLMNIKANWNICKTNEP